MVGECLHFPHEGQNKNRWIRHVLFIYKWRAAIRLPLRRRIPLQLSALLLSFRVWNGNTHLLHFNLHICRNIRMGSIKRNAKATLMDTSMDIDAPTNRTKSENSDVYVMYSLTLLFSDHRKL